MKREKIEKTNVMRLLDRAHIAYTPHFYDHQDGVIDGAGVAKKLNQDPRCVFKTLVTRGKSGNYHVFCIPVEKELDLKKCAVAAKEKAVEMLHVKDLLPLTGYVRGGCSPIGMKKPFSTVVDNICLNCPTIIFSAGKIGTQVEVKPADLLAYIGATTADLVINQDE